MTEGGTDVPDIRVSKEPIGIESDPDLHRFFHDSKDLFAEDILPTGDGATRKFEHSDVEAFWELLRDSPDAAAVVAYNDFPYTANKTLSKPEIEREYWLRLSRDALPANKQQVAGKDGYAIMHLHYDGVWDTGDSQAVFDSKRSTIKQINIRHTWDSSRPPGEKFWKQCVDLNKWREGRGRPVLGEREAPSGWKWRDHDHPEGATAKPWFTPHLRALLRRAEGCTKVVRKKYFEHIPAPAAAAAAAVSAPPPASGIGADSSGQALEGHTEPDWSALDAPADATRPFAILFVGVDNGKKTEPDLKLQEEFAQIESAHRESNICHLGETRVRTKQILFSQLADVMMHIRTFKPTALHFGCHADRGVGLELFRQQVRASELLDLLTSWNESARRKGYPEIRLVILNACESDELASKLTSCIDFVIGHREPVVDEDAIKFSKLLYSSLFDGDFLWTSFRQAKSASTGYRFFAQRDAREFQLVESKPADTPQSPRSWTSSASSGYSALKSPQRDKGGRGSFQHSRFFEASANDSPVFAAQRAMSSGKVLFIGYRVNSDEDLVERIYDKLLATGVPVWWDQKCLQPGMPWEEGFADGLNRADVFMPVISRAALANFSNLTPDSKCDNVLLEHQLALELMKRNQLRRIFPVLVGELEKHNHLGEVHGDFFKGDGMPNCPDVVVRSVDEKLAEHLQRMGKGEIQLSEADRTVAATLKAILEYHGTCLRGFKKEATAKVVDEVATMWCGEVDSSPTALGIATSPHDYLYSPISRDETNELVAFLKSKGLKAIAGEFSKQMGMELVESLEWIREEEVDNLSFLLPWQKRRLITLARDVTAQCASVRSLSANAANSGSERSKDDTDQGGQDDTSSASGDDTALSFDTVLTKHPGDPADFQKHMTGFVHAFLGYMRTGVEADDEWDTYDVSLGDNMVSSTWTWCMLLWIRFVADKSRQLDESLLSKWLDACKSGPSQDSLLDLFASCLISSETDGIAWSRDKFKLLGCKKQHAESIFITDSMVHNHLGGHPNIQEKWENQVVGSWYDDDASFHEFLTRANRFLRNHVEQNIGILQKASTTYSYVAFMRMTPLASLLLFEYLEARKRDDTATSGASGGRSSLFHGFRMLVSSSKRNKIFSLTKADVLAQGARPMVFQGLRCLSRLSEQAWELLGPMKTAREYVRKAQAAEENAEAYLKAKDSEPDDDKSGAMAGSNTAVMLEPVAEEQVTGQAKRKGKGKKSGPAKADTATDVASVSDVERADLVMMELLAAEEAEASARSKKKTKGKKAMSSEEAAADLEAYRASVAEAMKKAEEEELEARKKAEVEERENEARHAAAMREQERMEKQKQKEREQKRMAKQLQKEEAADAPLRVQATVSGKQDHASGARVTINPEQWKNRLCEHHQKGQCHRGKDCNFAHGEKDLQKYKTRLCKYYERGSCDHGKADCFFAHGANDLRRQCKFHFEFSGGCSQALSCPYSHVTEQRLHPRAGSNVTTGAAQEFGSIPQGIHAEEQEQIGSKHRDTIPAATASEHFDTEEFEVLAKSKPRSIASADVEDAIGQIYVDAQDSLIFSQEDIWRIFTGKEDGRFFKLCKPTEQGILGVQSVKGLNAFIVSYPTKSDAEEAYRFFAHAQSTTWRHDNRREAGLLIQMRSIESQRPTSIELDFALYVDGAPPGTQPHELRDLFTSYGQLHEIRAIQGRDNAFWVNFTNYEGAIAACEAARRKDLRFQSSILYANEGRNTTFLSALLADLRRSGRTSFSLDDAQRVAKRMRPDTWPPQESSIEKLLQAAPQRFNVDRKTKQFALAAPEASMLTQESLAALEQQAPTQERALDVAISVEPLVQAKDNRSERDDASLSAASTRPATVNKNSSLPTTSVLDEGEDLQRMVEQEDKTKPCLDFKFEGTCRFGEKCWYAHVTDDLPSEKRSYTEQLLSRSRSGQGDSTLPTASARSHTIASISSGRENVASHPAVTKDSCFPTSSVRDEIPQDLATRQHESNVTKAVEQVAETGEMNRHDQNAAQVQHQWFVDLWGYLSGMMSVRDKLHEFDKQELLGLKNKFHDAGLKVRSDDHEGLLLKHLARHVTRVMMIPPQDIRPVLNDFDFKRISALFPNEDGELIVSNLWLCNQFTNALAEYWARYHSVNHGERHKMLTVTLAKSWRAKTPGDAIRDEYAKKLLESSGKLSNLIMCGMKLYTRVEIVDFYHQGSETETTEIAEHLLEVDGKLYIGVYEADQRKIQVKSMGVDHECEVKTIVGESARWTKAKIVRQTKSSRRVRYHNGRYEDIKNVEWKERARVRPRIKLYGPRIEFPAFNNEVNIKRLKTALASVCREGLAPESISSGNVEILDVIERMEEDVDTGGVTVDKVREDFWTDEGEECVRIESSITVSEAMDRQTAKQNVTLDRLAFELCQQNLPPPIVRKPGEKSVEVKLIGNTVRVTLDIPLRRSNVEVKSYGYVGEYMHAVENILQHESGLSIVNSIANPRERKQEVSFRELKESHLSMMLTMDKHLDGIKTAAQEQEREKIESLSRLEDFRLNLRHSLADALEIQVARVTVASITRSEDKFGSMAHICVKGHVCRFDDTRLPNMAEFADKLQAQIKDPSSVVSQSHSVTSARERNDDDSVLNPEQLDAIETIRHDISGIQGPPGTGKSYMIAQILTDYIPHMKTLVTCVQNKAVDALILKLAAASADFFVIGARNEKEQDELQRRSKLTSESLRYTAWSLTRRDRTVREYAKAKALAILDRVHANIMYKTASGLKWKITGAKRPKGRELTNQQLSSALKSQTDFTQEEWDAFGIVWLSLGDFIKSGDSYFVPAELGSQRQRRALKDAASKESRAAVKMPANRFMMLTDCEEQAGEEREEEIKEEEDETFESGLDEIEAVEYDEGILKHLSAWSRIRDDLRKQWLIQESWAYIVDSLLYRYVGEQRLLVVERRTRVVLSTVDSTQKALRMLEQYKHDTDKAVKLFDAIILDEAGCVPEWKMPALTRFDPQWLIMVGDHKQLPPFTELPQKYAVSVLERFAKTLPEGVPMLKTQFRMHPTICQFISKHFYEGHLKTDDSKAKGYQNASAQKVISWYDCQGEELRDENHSFYNKMEVGLIDDMFFFIEKYGMQSILASRKHILVITFYSAQLKLLQDRLKNVLDDVNRDGIERMKIMTVDGSQGSEADLVILSCVRSNQDSKIGHLKDPRRMNVALSRAKERMIVVGNKETFAGRSLMHKMWSDLANSYQKMVRQPSYRKHELPSPQLKTEHCAHWLIGICPHGDMCQFLHDPVKQGSCAGKADEKDCVFWLKGVCRRDDCPFNHDQAKEGILRYLIETRPFQTFKNKDCIDWMKGACGRKDCLFQHHAAKKGLFKASNAQSSLNAFYAKHLVPLLSRKDDPEALHDLLKTHKLVEPDSGRWHEEPVFKGEDLKSRSILGVAARLGCHRIVEELIAFYDCDIDRQNEEGFTALYWAAWHAHPETVRVLLRHGARRDLRCFVHYQDTAKEAAIFAQKFWSESSDAKRQHAVFPREKGNPWRNVDPRCREDYQWSPDWSKIILMLGDDSAESSRDVRERILYSENIEDMCKVVNDHLSAIDHETLVVAWKWMLAEINAKPVGEYVQQTLLAVEKVTVNKVRELEFKDFSRIVYVFAKESYHPQDELKDALSSALENMPNISGRAEMVNTAWAFAKLNIVPHEGFFQAVSKTKDLIQDLSPTLMSNFLWAFATFDRMPDAELFQQMLSQTKGMQFRFLFKDIATMLESFAKLWTRTGQLERGQVHDICTELLRKGELLISSKTPFRQIDDTLLACEKLGLEPSSKLEEAREKKRVPLPTQVLDTLLPPKFWTLWREEEAEDDDDED